MPKRTVAIVLKEKLNLASFVLTFEAQGFEVRAFSDGEMAFQELSASPADIAILGRRLPGLDGPVLFGRLRRTCSMPTIFVSSYGPDLVDHAPGARDYLPTGCPLHIVVERVRMILEGGTSRLSVDGDRRICRWHRQRLYLNAPEFLMLEQLARGGIHTRFALMAAAYGPSIEMMQDVVDGHIRSIVKRFGDIDPRTRAIDLVGGVAYRLGKSI